MEWSPPEEPSCSRLDERILLGRRQTPRQWSSPFTTSSRDHGTPPTLLASVLPLHSPSLQLTSLKKRSMRRCLFWTSQWLHTFARPSVQVTQDYFSACWTLLCFIWTGGFRAPLYGGPSGLSGQTPLCHGRVWAWSCNSQGVEKCNKPGPAHHQNHRPGDRVVYGQPGGALAPIFPNGLFWPVIEGFAERFTEAQKLSQAMRDFLPKCSSSAAASSSLKPTKQPAKPAPATPAPQPVKTQQTRGRSRSARRHPFPKHQSPRPKTALASCVFLICRTGRGECQVQPRPNAHQTASLKLFFTPFISGCRWKCVCCKYRARTSAQATAHCNSVENKIQTFSKREQISSSVPHECPASVQPVTRVYPTPCHVGQALAGHSQSVRVGYGDNKTRLFIPKLSWNQGMFTCPRCFPLHSELRSSRSPCFLLLKRTGSYPCSAPVRAWWFTLSILLLLGDTLKLSGLLLAYIRSWEYRICKSPQQPSKRCRWARCMQADPALPVALLSCLWISSAQNCAFMYFFLTYFYFSFYTCNICNDYLWQKNTFGHWTALH